MATCFVGLLILTVSAASAFRGNTITDEVKNVGGIDCQAPLDVGDCDKQEEAWYYRPEEDRCAFFVFSGCGGNGNKFSSRGNCEAACMSLPRCPEIDCPSSCSTTKDAEDCNVCACTKGEAERVCSEVHQRGYCRALQHKWAWDAKERRCVEFVYGGCGGNENNFDTEESCYQICSAL